MRICSGFVMNDICKYAFFFSGLALWTIASLFFAKDLLEHPAVGFGFLCQRHGVGTRTAGHAVEAELFVANSERCAAGHLGLCNAKVSAEGVGGFLARGNDGAAKGHAGQKAFDVGGRDDLEKLVGGIVLQTPHSARRVVDAYALRVEKLDDLSHTVCLLLGVDKVERVAEENEPEDAPHVVREVGVYKQPIHAYHFVNHHI